MEMENTLESLTSDEWTDVTVRFPEELHYIAKEHVTLKAFVTRLTLPLGYQIRPCGTDTYEIFKAD